MPKRSLLMLCVWASMSAWAGQRRQVVVQVSGPCAAPVTVQLADGVAQHVSVCDVKVDLAVSCTKNVCHGEARRGPERLATFDFEHAWSAKNLSASLKLEVLGEADQPTVARVLLLSARDATSEASAKLAPGERWSVPLAGCASRLELRHGVSAEGRLTLDVSGGKVPLRLLTSPAELPASFETVDACGHALQLRVDVPR